MHTMLSSLLRLELVRFSFGQFDDSYFYDIFIFKIIYCYDFFSARYTFFTIVSLVYTGVCFVQTEITQRTYRVDFFLKKN